MSTQPKEEKAYRSVPLSHRASRVNARCSWKKVAKGAGPDPVRRVYNFHVDLEASYLNLILKILLAGDMVEYVFHGTRYYASLRVGLSEHRVSFPTTGLPVSENCAIEPLQNTLYHGLGRLLINLLLLCLRVKEEIEIVHLLFEILFNLVRSGQIAG